ncbi:Crp/Fnr family transcriptional regulator [Paucibacter soli]|uniref:Crp/Fnr family transcriptional regulator n=1 Tax=Paucibacter soli TaxID=3133433 RepID=UPI0030A6A9CB
MTHISLTQMLESSLWGRRLGAAELQRVLHECRERPVAARELLVRSGAKAEYWMGLISGFGKMSVSTADGRETTLISIAAGGWFGEGTLIKHGHWQYDAVALRDCRVALMPRETFEWLRATSLPFNHYLQQLMSARMGSFIARLSHDRLLDSTERVARCLASFFNPELYPEPGQFLELSQSELGQLAGVSRQRANIALHQLEDAGLLGTERRGIKVLDLDGLRNYTSPA